MKLFDFITNVYANSSILFIMKLLDMKDKKIDIKDLKLLVDPLDGTNSFIKKHYTPTTVLIGMLHKNEPIFGFVSSPFYNIVADSATLYFNLPKLGVFKIVLDSNNEISKIKQISSSNINAKKEDSFKFITSDWTIEHIKNKCNIYHKKLIYSFS